MCAAESIRCFSRSVLSLLSHGKHHKGYTEEAEMRIRTGLILKCLSIKWNWIANIDRILQYLSPMYPIYVQVERLRYHCSGVWCTGIGVGEDWYRHQCQPGTQCRGRWRCTSVGKNADYKHHNHCSLVSVVGDSLRWCPDLSSNVWNCAKYIRV